MTHFLDRDSSANRGQKNSNIGMAFLLNSDSHYFLLNITQIQSLVSIDKQGMQRSPAFMTYWCVLSKRLQRSITVRLAKWQHPIMAQQAY